MVSPMMVLLRWPTCISLAMFGLEKSTTTRWALETLKEALDKNGNEGWGEGRRARNSTPIKMRDFPLAFQTPLESMVTHASRPENKNKKSFGRLLKMLWKMTWSQYLQDI